MASPTSSTSSTGAHLVLAGLLLQIIVFGFFVVVSLVFHHRMKVRPTVKSHHTGSISWEAVMYVLYVVSGLILVRSVVRIAEFVEGFNGYIILHETSLYVFDALPMIAVVLIFSIWYRANLLDNAPTAKMNDGSVNTNVGDGDAETCHGVALIVS